MLLRRIVIFIPYWLVFRWLILRNLRLRAEGKLPDEWYWTDRLCWMFGQSTP